MKKPKLSEDYEGLKRQFNALFTICSGQEVRITQYQKQIAKLQEYHHLHSEEEFSALRDTIEILTNRIEELEK